VVDALGGVTLCNRSGRRLDDAYANLHMGPGCQEMNGVKALAFVRARHVDSDFGRIGRQQEFLRAVLAEVDRRSGLTSLPTLKGVAEIATDHIKTDDTLGTGTALGLARRLRPRPGLARHARLPERRLAAPLRRRRRRGAAARAAAGLRRLGVQVAGIGNAPSPTGQGSTLAYPPGLAPRPGCSRPCSAARSGWSRPARARRWC
jgi:hypothetical protein